MLVRRVRETSSMVPWRMCIDESRERIIHIARTPGSVLIRSFAGNDLVFTSIRHLKEKEKEKKSDLTCLDIFMHRNEIFLFNQHGAEIMDAEKLTSKGFRRMDIYGNQNPSWLGFAATLNPKDETVHVVLSGMYSVVPLTGEAALSSGVRLPTRGDPLVDVCCVEYDDVNRLLLVGTLRDGLFAYENGGTRMKWSVQNQVLGMHVVEGKLFVAECKTSSVLIVGSRCGSLLDRIVLRSAGEAPCDVFYSSSSKRLYVGRLDGLEIYENTTTANKLPVHFLLPPLRQIVIDYACSW